MHGSRLDALSRSLATGHSRRGLASLLAGLALAGPLCLANGTGTLAKKTGRKAKKKKKRKGRQTTITGPPPVCTPTCAASNACGDDGCNGSCGPCVDPGTCTAGTCTCPDHRAPCGANNLCCSADRHCSGGLCFCNSLPCGATCCNPANQRCNGTTCETCGGLGDTCVVRDDCCEPAFGQVTRDCDGPTGNTKCCKPSMQPCGQGQDALCCSGECLGATSSVAGQCW
jgi:hypothetical protein